MKVIGLKGTPESRKTNWLDLVEAKKSFKYFENASGYREKRTAAIDKDFYVRHLNSYVA